MGYENKLKWQCKNQQIAKLTFAAVFYVVSLISRQHRDTKAAVVLTERSHVEGRKSVEVKLQKVETKKIALKVVKFEVSLV